MAEQRNRTAGGLSPDQCIDFAAGLLNEEERAEVLRLAARSPEAEALLQSVLAQADSARSAVETRRPQREMAREPAGRDRDGLLARVLNWLFPAGRMAPALAGASLLILGMVLGAGTVSLLDSGGTVEGAPAQLISLFPTVNRDAGATAISGGHDLYIELNGLHAAGAPAAAYTLQGPAGEPLSEGPLWCDPETGEWAGIHLPASLLAAAGEYVLEVCAGKETATYRFTMAH